ncbi:NusA-like transcription termination signal-binding factor, partial [Candidatus Micrarchaeota archaeon CG_4_10_14_0_8_um_filter_60_7]
MKLSMQEIGLLNLLESATGAQGRDAVAVGEKLVFVVNEGQLGRAIGKGGEGLRRLEARVGKQVEVVEYAEGAEKFARNLFA